MPELTPKIPKYPVQINQEIIDFAKKRKKLNAQMLEAGINKWVCADVIESGGYQIPLLAAIFDTEEEAQRGCDVHNNYIGLTSDEVDRIVFKSML